MTKHARYCGILALCTCAMSIQAMNGTPAFDAVQARRIVASWQAEDVASCTKKQSQSRGRWLVSCLWRVAQIGRRFAPAVALATLVGQAHALVRGRPACDLHDPCHDQYACPLKEFACRQVAGQIAEQVATFRSGDTCVAAVGGLIPSERPSPDGLASCECYRTDVGDWQLWCFVPDASKRLLNTERLLRSRVHGFMR